ncbi:MAG: hydrogenase formation protein HypD [Synergistaceae bacterium]|nr:hydrogenase formation protein HypD [Synergistaceae bacterium]
MSDAKALREETGRLSRLLAHLCERPMTVMEVCGTHTVAVFRQGLRALLPPALRLVSGPGCPVCVTDQAEIDAAVALARRADLTLATYGDMLRVPGQGSSLAEERARGADVAVITSAAQALALARTSRKTVVFLAVGFETTAPATAAVVAEAARSKVENFSVLCLHKRVPPVMKLLASDRDLALDGFLLPGHVAVIIGLEPFRFLAEDYGLPSVVAGFEALEIMAGLVELARQHRAGRSEVVSRYPAVGPDGNAKARRLLEEVFDTAPALWRGLGRIDGSGFVLKKSFASFDAAQRLGVTYGASTPPEGCRCGDVLAGKITPTACPLFGRTCNPSRPVGPCMVSSEGSCSAYYLFRKGGHLS